MSTITFDTQELVRELSAAGLPPAQADAVVRALVKAQDGLVTREHFDAKIELLRVESQHTRWMLGAVLALAVANFAKQFF
jgi:hypothetical protein